MGIFLKLCEDIPFAVDVHFGFERYPGTIELEHIVGIAGEPIVVPMRCFFEDGRTTVGDVFDEVVEKVEAEQLLW